ncbi:MAG: undecaprenyldiphospho-muramoylpentapeptide beta-N-acetylglucosaminyltransferase [Pseudomonadota bacterium]
MTAPHLILAAGGTGGHMFPAQALAEEMLARGWRVSLSTDKRGARYADGFPDAVTRRVVSSGTFGRSGLWAKIAAPFQIAAGVLGAVVQMRRDPPGVVVGFGGYPALPALAAAVLRRTPRMLHEQNGVLGRVNRLFARHVDRVACAVWPTDLPAGAEGVHTGNPVRAAIRERAGAPYDPPLDEGALSVLVFGGSQGARILSETVPPALAEIPGALRGRLRVVQQARAEEVGAVEEAYRAADIAAEVMPFIHDMADRLAAAQLVICRAGASSVADIAAIGRPAIFVPLAIAIRDEQTANARPLTEAGAALTVAERDLTPTALAGQITAILTDPGRAAQMAEAARRLGRPNAAHDLADLVETLRERGT